MDNRYQTIYSGRSEQQPSALANFGRSSLANTGSFALNGGQMHSNFQPANDNDVVMNFFEGGSDSVSGNYNPDYRNKGLEHSASSFPNSHRSEFGIHGELSNNYSKPKVPQLRNLNQQVNLANCCFFTLIASRAGCVKKFRCTEWPRAGY